MSGRKLPIPIGERYGRLTILSLHSMNGKRVHLLCACDCGRQTIAREDCLKSGNTRSCGCLQRESIKANTKHGMWLTRTYRIWAGMKSRCSESCTVKRHLYVDKGIRVCERWQQFENFLEDMGEAPDGLTLERLDGDKNYEPGNCVWATYKQQANNSTANHRLTVNGMSKTMAQWGEYTGIKPNTIIYRLRRGWDANRAVGLPDARSSNG